MISRDFFSRLYKRQGGVDVDARLQYPGVFIGFKYLFYLTDLVAGLI